MYMLTDIPACRRTLERTRPRAEQPWHSRGELSWGTSTSAFLGKRNQQLSKLLLHFINCSSSNSHSWKHEFVCFFLYPLPSSELFNPKFSNSSSCQKSFYTPLKNAGRMEAPGPPSFPPPIPSPAGSQGCAHPLPASRAQRCSALMCMTETKPERQYLPSQLLVYRLYCEWRRATLLSWSFSLVNNL